MDPGMAVLVAGGLAFFSPLLTTWLLNRNRAAERAEDRADRLLVAQKVDNAASAAKVVAQKAAGAAELLLDAQHLTLTKTDEVAAAARVTTMEMNSQLKQIHTLVNSTLTAALKGELTQARASIEFLRRLGADAENATDIDKAAVEETLKRIGELESAIADRDAQTVIAAETLATEKHFVTLTM
jgi:hypothetical protein